MKSSEDIPIEAEMTELVDEDPPRPRRDVPTAAEVRAMMPEEPTWKYWVRRIDVPVQLARIGIILFFWWIWASEIVWDGWDSFSVLGVQPFPNVPETFRASPGGAWDYLTDNVTDRLFWEDAWVTLKEAMVGFIIAAVLGVIFGLILGGSKRVAKVLGPFLVLFNAMPKIAFLPLILVVYGVGEMSKIVLVVLIVFFIIEVPTQSAVALVDPDLDMVAETMGASQYQRFTKVTLPAILPAVVGGLRLGSIIAVQAAIFGEIFSARRGLGQRLITAANQLNYDALFALVFVLALIALILNGAIGGIERHFLRWQTQGGGGQPAAEAGGL